MICEGTKERHNSPSALGVKTGGRFVKEEEKFGLRVLHERAEPSTITSYFHYLGCELDADCSTLTMLNAERPDSRLRIFLKAAHL